MKANFRIDPDYLTDYIRGKWAEDKKQHCFDIAESCEISKSNITRLINGELKMVEGDKDHSGYLVSDNWDPWQKFDRYGGWDKPDKVGDADKQPNTGWIAPNGYFYYARYGQHQYICHSMDLSETEADNKGWVKLFSSYKLDGNMLVICKRGYHPNKKQSNKLLDWCTANKYSYPEHFGGSYNNVTLVKIT